MLRGGGEFATRVVFFPFSLFFPPFLLSLADSETFLLCLGAKYRAKNDIKNAVYAGFLAGGILALNSGGGPKGVLGGAAAFAAFSGAIDLYMRKEVV